jgi:hypothetical protein
MPASKNVTSRIRTWTLFALLTLLASCTCAEQEPAPTVGNYVVLGRDFLRALYPRLNGHTYALSIEMSINYDVPQDAVHNLQLDVGEGSKGRILGYAGGWRGEKPKDFKPGPIHPRQLLTAIFGFEKGQLLGFTASGPAVGNRDAREALAKLVRVEHPEMADEEANLQLKKAGAKYGPADREDFVRSLPIATLERFVGKLAITSVELCGTGSDGFRDSYWPDWTVQGTVTQLDGQRSAIRMYFEPFNGDLEALDVTPIKR